MIRDADIGHLMRRFVECLDPRPIASRDLSWVKEILLPVEFELWQGMQLMDKRHSIGVARRLVGEFPSVSRIEIAAALLHDVGKSKSSLGVIARIAATVAGPRTSRWAEYCDHETIGAEVCRMSGVDQRICDVIMNIGPSDAVDRLRRADYL